MIFVRVIIIASLLSPLCSLNAMNAIEQVTHETPGDSVQESSEFSLIATMKSLGKKVFSRNTQNVSQAESKQNLMHNIDQLTKDKKRKETMKLLAQSSHILDMPDFQSIGLSLLNNLDLEELQKNNGAVTDIFGENNELWGSDDLKYFLIQVLIQNRTQASMITKLNNEIAQSNTTQASLSTQVSTYKTLIQPLLQTSQEHETLKIQMSALQAELTTLRTQQPMNAPQDTAPQANLLKSYIIRDQYDPKNSSSTVS
jgi:hypothetical protein